MSTQRRQAPQSVDDALKGVESMDVDKLISDATKAAERAANMPPSQLDDLSYDKGLEEDCEAELSETLKAFKAAAANEQKQFEDNTDSEYWVCFCFQNRDQKEEFLTKAGLIADGDKYVDGVEAAKKLGFQVSLVKRRFITKDRDSRIADLPKIKPGRK